MDTSASKRPRRALIGDSPGVMPWTDAARIFRHCTGCGACTRACPEGIVASGRGGHPFVAFHAACTFCRACAEACPEEVFDLSRDPAMAAVAVIGAGCFEAQGIACRACEDACPERALRTRPRLGGTAQVEVDAEACTGCGGCVAVCPTQVIEVRSNV